MGCLNDTADIVGLIPFKLGQTNSVKGKKKQ